jgi:N-acetylglucosaminyldiphosphoundecaprenol N-acetyl-beta-D-mannosaminyltransferase
MHKSIDFLGIKIGGLTRDQIINQVLEYASTGKCRFMTYLNAHCANIYFADFEYREALQKSDLVYSGGQGVVWASRFLGGFLPERVNILDFFDGLVRKLKEEGVTVYLLGGSKNTVKKAEKFLRDKGLKILGSRDGFFDKTEEAEIIKEINRQSPDILMVGMGVPKQEKWIYGHLKELNVNLCWAVGGVFELLAGRLKRSPVWVSDCGLEWLYLGFQDPGRLLKRYLIGNFIFVYRVLDYKVKNIWRGQLKRI